MSISMKSSKSEILAAYEASQERIAQLERNAEDDQRRIGVMMYDAREMSIKIESLEAEIAGLEVDLEQSQALASQLEVCVHELEVKVGDMFTAEDLENEVQRLEVGVLVNQLEASNQRAKSLSNERDDLIIENERLTESCVAAYQRCDALEAIVAAKSASQPQRQVASKPLPSPAVVDAAPTIEVTDFDRAMWAKFQALPRETRLEIINFARPEWGHVGIHNITEIRAAWRAAKPISA